MKKITSSLALIVILTASMTPPVMAARLKPVAKSSATTLGNDVSYPQCNKRLPNGQAFGIVGVNDGLANTVNPCLASELAWAQTSSGITSQPKSALYVNTANPGNLGVADWPTSGATPSYGTCNGGDNQACAYVYGWQRAQADSGFLTAAAPTANPADFTWWLDVETANSWETNLANNQAVLEGMTDYFHGIKASVGLYSTAAQWSQIVGTVSSGSLTGLPDWRPGGASLSTAKQACTAAPLTAGGTVSITQYTSRSTDYDYSCQG